MAEISGGEAFGRALKQEGVEYVFSLNGGHIYTLYEGCEDNGIKVIDFRHEQAAAHAAEGWANPLSHRQRTGPRCEAMNMNTGNSDFDDNSKSASDQNRSELTAAWTKAFGSAPPPHMSRGFLQKALVYHAQCKEFGGLPRQTQRTLRAIALGKPISTVTTGKIKPGAHLAREWNGRTYQVAIVDDGYRFDGNTYGSLTAIAKRITGTNWSGPRFFGVNGVRH